MDGPLGEYEGRTVGAAIGDSEGKNDGEFVFEAVGKKVGEAVVDTQIAGKMPVEFRSQKGKRLMKYAEPA